MQYSDNVSINHKARESPPIDKLPEVFGNEDNNIINSNASIISSDFSKAESLVDVLRYRNQYQGSDKAYTFLPKGETEEITITYQELDKKARAIAAMLQSMEANGKRALLLYQPGLEFIAAFFGCLYAGVIAVPVYPPRRNHHGNRMQAIVSDAQATIALTTTSVFNNIENTLKSETELANLSYITTDLIDSEKASDWQYPQIDKNTLAFLQYTSGSTGTPKGVMISHGNLLYNEEMIQQGFGHTSDTIFVGWLPLYHDMGLIGNILQPMYLGIHCVFMPPTAFLQKPIRWLQAISRYKATTSGGPNFAYDFCVEKIKPEQLEGLDLSNWEVAFSGAEPVRARTIERFTETFAKCGFRQQAFYPCYGMAETTLFVSGGLKSEEPIIRAVNGTELWQNRVVFTDTSKVDSQEFVSCGCTWMEQKIAIVNPETLIECNYGEVGEIWVSGGNIARGYWRKPKLTETTFNAYIADTVKGPFLRTGDLGFLQDGELFITGRIKDVIIIRGQNHYPQDIELTVENSHIALKPGSGAAFTVEVNNQERLVIVQEVERTYLRKLNIYEVVGDISEAVTAKHGLQVYSTVFIKTGSIPKTSSGKIQRHACKNAFLNGSLKVLQDWSENPSQKSNFRHLKTEVESLLYKVQSCK
ncbi:fatty acyl-AMP ligase [Calothrix rhizosoleniae]|uniref:fatty acyl-AMP ligase n=1 Tax=Calothrix rhizosoleniae TaxID=888997 RepID=UPI000B4A3B08|nr:fatty acyl-AMP ligase [Calothrix rhizosoleniae]